MVFQFNQLVIEANYQPGGQPTAMKFPLCLCLRKEFECSGLDSSRSSLKSSFKDPIVESAAEVPHICKVAGAEPHEISPGRDCFSLYFHVVQRMLPSPRLFGNHSGDE
jgi:hypothetical protein